MLQKRQADKFYGFMENNFYGRYSYIQISSEVLISRFLLEKVSFWLDNKLGFVINGTLNFKYQCLNGSWHRIIVFQFK